MYHEQRVHNILKRAPIVVFEAHWLPRRVWFQSDGNDDRYIVHQVLSARNTQCRVEGAREAPVVYAYASSGMSPGYRAISMWMKLMGLVDLLLGSDFRKPLLQENPVEDYCDIAEFIRYRFQQGLSVRFLILEYGYRDIFHLHKNDNLIFGP